MNKKKKNKKKRVKFFHKDTLLKLTILSILIQMILNVITIIKTLLK